MPRTPSKTILVTGGSGFIGSNFIRFLYTKYPEYKIYNFDLLTYAGNPDNLADIELVEAGLSPDERRYVFVQGDINNPQFLDSFFAKHSFDAIVNFAAETHVDRSIVSANDFLHTNVGGARSLAEAVRKHKIPRCLHISTDEVYGDVPEGQTTNEDSPLRPSSPYSSSKAAGDLILQSYHRTYGIPLLIIRGSNNYGPFQYPEKLIPLAISNFVEGKTIPIHGNGGHLRSWLHVEDFSDAIDRVLHDGKVGHIYNVSGEERTNLQVLETIAKNLGINEHQSLFTYVPDRPGADLRYAPHSHKIERELGWKPVHVFDDSINAVVEWYKANRLWWQKIKGRTEYLEHYERQSKGNWW